MDGLLEILSRLVSLAGMIYLALLCGVGVLLSMLTLSGTWLVVVAAVSAFLARGGFPGIGTVLAFVYLAILVEVAEYVLGYWGVRKQGGSNRAALVALAGSMLGLAFGGLLAFPVWGALLGIPIGGFAAVYAYERYRDQSAGQAARVAWGVVLSRFGVLLLKLTVTMGMTLWLFAGILRS
jgi:uncharacterized protein YqgC (DUF456 family)